MTDQKTAVVNDGTTGEVKPSSDRKTTRGSDKKRCISDERRFQDALEDDEVRVVLRRSLLARSKEWPRGCRPLARRRVDR